MRIRTFGRHLKEGTKNIVRNGWMTFAAVSAVTVTLLILGVFLVLAMNINHIAEVIENQVEITVELDLSIEESQISPIEDQIRNIDGVKSVVFVSKEEGLEQLKERFGEDAYLLEGLEEENPLNDIFIVKAYKPENIDYIAKEITKIDLVTGVDYGKTTVDKLFAVTRWIRHIGLIFVVGLSFTAMFLIANTIKITIYARKREIEIMKLVGATNWFIRWPFFVEGTLLGILGSLVPIVLIVFGYEFLLEKLNSNLTLSFFQLLPLYPLAYQISILLVSIGVFIGVWGSMMSVHRFLKI
ncbi:cell division protein FtsX [Vulcanibacillus modesticaldus]|uniref:Cell division protein FtsX n=1 Tax=Vulcanibacillus modesticaldus TaxID=337097 RepID=A0A1D2YWN5_9BACI|nr:permease-like cell division protein FtsX [Vulcanibacillus modesticaldus]OEG00130.1 cell division protein FtsX [Vulcanibacillus modesticaldus]